MEVGWLGDGVVVAVPVGDAVAVAVTVTGESSTEAEPAPPSVTSKVVEALRETPTTRPMTFRSPTPVVTGIVTMLLPRPLGAIRAVVRTA